MLVKHNCIDMKGKAAQYFLKLVLQTGAGKKTVKLAALLFIAALTQAQPCTPPVVDLGEDVTQCGGFVTLDAGNPGATYLWSDNSTGQTLDVTVSNTYTVTVTNAPNCSATGTINISINPVPVVNLGPDVAHCGGNVTLDAGDGGGFNLNIVSQSNTFSKIAGFYQTDIAQSFVPTQSNISGASVTLFNNPAGNGDITISLYSDLPNNGGVLLASGTATNVSAGGTATVSWPTVYVSPLATYYLVFTSSNTSLSLAGDIADPYPGGQSYANAGYQPQAGDDYAFSTFATTGYVWSDGSNKRQLQVSTSGDYHVTVTNAFDCSATGSVNVYIKPVPVVNLGPDITQCGGNVTLDAGTPGSTYHWSNASTGQFLTVSASATVSVTVTDPNSGCTGMDDVKVDIQTVPVVNLGPDIAQCGGSVTLDAGNPGSTYHWNNQDATQTIKITTSGYYTVTVMSGVNCSASGSVNVQFQPVPALGADKSDNICPFSTADLTKFYTTQGLTVQYSSPNPTTVTGGVYTIIATNSFGCSDTALVTISYFPQPNLGPDVTDSVCPYTTTSLTKYVSDPNLTYSYGVANPTAVPAGVYTIHGTNSNGCTDTLIITIVNSKKPDLGNDYVDSICIGNTVDLTSLYSSAGYSNYVWNTLYPTSVTAGNYTLTVTSFNGCMDTANAIITNRQHPHVTLDEPHDICYTNGPLLLTGGSPVGGTYRVDSTIETSLDPVKWGIGNHLVTYVFTNASGCIDSATVEIIVHAQPFVTTIMAPDMCTTSTPIDLEQFFTPTGGQYSGIGVSGHFFYPTITPSGFDTIIDLYTDEFGCKDTSVYPIQIHRAVNTQITSSIAELSICEGQPVTFTATGAETYEFFVNGVSQGFATTVNTFTTTTLADHDMVTVAGSNMCSADTVGPIIYDVHPLPQANAGNDTSIALGSSVQLNGGATGSGLLIYQWIPAKGLNTSVIPQPIYSGVDSVTFTLFVSDIYGCMDSDEVQIGVFIPDAIPLPNIITPDGDGLNDTWKINPKIDLTGSSLVVFDRWGSNVWEKENYANDWDGTYKATGKKLPDGTYYYVFKVPSQNNHVYRGAVSILNGK